MKKILGIYSAPGQHWVGDGFPVRSLFSYNSHGRHMSPFLLLDYAGPLSFTPTTNRRGVGEHPHRGFETVTIVYRGEVQHRDSTGAGGTSEPIYEPIVGYGPFVMNTEAQITEAIDDFNSGRFGRI